MALIDSPDHGCRDWAAELTVRLKEALQLLHSVAAACNPAACGTGCVPQGGSRLDGENLALGPCDDCPGFLKKTGVPSGEWSEGVRLALHRGSPKAWTDYECDMGAMRCVIKHSLSPFAGGVLGALQYYPLMLREKSPGERARIYAELPMGIYSLDVKNTFLHTMDAAQFLFTPPYE